MKEREFPHYRVHELVLIHDSYKSGLSHSECGLIHGVSKRTSAYAIRWCEKTRPLAEAFVSRQNVSSLRYYLKILRQDTGESLSLQEGCRRHGCTPRTYRIWEYAYYSGLIGSRLAERTGKSLPIKQDIHMTGQSKDRKAAMASLEKELESLRRENEYLRCENEYLKKKSELRRILESLPEHRDGGER